jgi:hypothetical protein
MILGTGECPLVISAPRVPRCRHADRHLRRNRTSGKWPRRATREHRPSGRHRLAVQGTSCGEGRPAARCLARPRRAARSRRQPRRRRLRTRRHRHAVGLGGGHGTGERRRARRQDRHLDGERPRAGEQGVPATGAATRQCGGTRPSCRSALARGCRVPPPAGGGAGEDRRADRLRRADLRRRSRAVQQVSDIIAEFPGCRPLDVGELSNATAIEAFTAVLLQLNVRYKTRVAPKLTGIKRDPRAVVPG